MSNSLNATHNPALRSRVESANDGRTDFPIQNLPHGVFRRAGTTEAFRGGVAIGNEILDVGAAAATGMLVHHTENGCAMAPGDVIGSGTDSGPTDGEKGCLMELTSGGRQAIVLANGETRTLLEDGDTVILRAWAERHGAVRIAPGACRGTVLPARPG